MVESLVPLCWLDVGGGNTAAPPTCPVSCMSADFAKTPVYCQASNTEYRLALRAGNLRARSLGALRGGEEVVI